MVSRDSRGTETAPRIASLSKLGDPLAGKNCQAKAGYGSGEWAGLGKGRSLEELDKQKELHNSVKKKKAKKSGM